VDRGLCSPCRPDSSVVEGKGECSGEERMEEGWKSNVLITYQEERPERLKFDV
jgi:hypothetical protein